MNRHLLIAQFLSTPWALMPERLAAMSAVLGRWQAGIAATPDVMAQVRADAEAREARRATTQQVATGGIAILNLHGVVTQRGNMADDISGPGSISIEKFTAAFRAVLADSQVGAIVIDIDSPGGSVYGVGELAAEIVAARGTKPIIGVANSLAASAAYWIGCACDELYVTPGGEVGSIGVWQAHDDVSAAMDAAGVKRTYISAGKFKVEGNPMEPLADDARAFMQSRVDDYYGMFTKAVAKGRGVPIAQVREGMGQGRVLGVDVHRGAAGVVLGADAAVAEKMVDGIATFDATVGIAIKRMRAARSAAVAAELPAPVTAAEPAPVVPAATRLAIARRELEIMG